MYSEREGKRKIEMTEIEREIEILLQSLIWVFCFIQPNLIPMGKAWLGPC